MASSKIIVSPGVYTTETDLTYVAQSLGVTTLGVVGEAPSGPAFEPVFIKNFTEYSTFFGTLNPEKYAALPSLPKYEMGYIAKQYLEQSNQLFVTRVLGLSGYNAGKAYVITAYANIDFYKTNSVGNRVLYNHPTVTGSTYVGTKSTTDWGITISGTDVKLSMTTSDPMFGTGNTFNQNGMTIYSTDGSGDDNTVISTDLISPISITGWTKSDTDDCTFYIIQGTLSADTTSNITTLTNNVVYSASCQSNYDKLVVAMVRSRVTTSNDYDVTDDEQYLVRNDSGIADGLNNVLFKDFDSINDPNGEFYLSGYTKGSNSELFTYKVSLDSNKKSYISKVLGGAGNAHTCVYCNGPKSKNTEIWVEEIYPKMYQTMVQYERLYGIAGIERINDDLSNYGYDDGTGVAPIGYETPETPWIVSELRGNKVDRLFKFQSISDGENANVEIKISIANINLATGEFDVIIRKWDDTDAKIQVLEKYQKCNLTKDSNNYIGKKIGTSDGKYDLKSSFTMLILNSNHPEDAIPSGFEGYPMRYDQVEPAGGSVGDLRNMRPMFKTKYYDIGEVLYSNPITGYEIQAAGDKPPFYRKKYLGFNRAVGMDPSVFAYKGYTTSGGVWTTMSKGFHMDSGASDAVINKIDTSQLVVAQNATGFEVGSTTFRNEDDLENTEYESLFSRKFTVSPYGGFDGWDPNRGRRTNGDNYRRGKQTYNNSGFLGETSDWYAYLAGIQTFSNPEAVNINIFATPGIDYVNNKQLIDEAITTVEEDRADSLYILTTPDIDYQTGFLYTPEDAVDNLDNADLDTNYSATYYPWIKYNDMINNVSIYIPPTAEVMRNIALTDNIAFPWFAVGGYTRGLVKAPRARTKLTLADRDLLYENRLNPIATFNDVGVVIWGQKTLQVAESALDRINVRRLLLQTRKLIATVAKRLVFEQNDDVVRNEFLNLVNPILDGIKNERGLTDFRVQLINGEEDMDQLLLRGKIFLKPTRALEFIDLEFVITPTSASFENV